MCICRNFPAYVSKANHRVNRRTLLYMCLSVCRHRSLDFHKQLVMLCASALMPHSTHFRGGCLLQRAELLPFEYRVPFRCLAGQAAVEELAGQSALGLRAPAGSLSNTLDGWNAKWIIIHALPLPFPTVRILGPSLCPNAGCFMLPFASMGKSSQHMQWAAGLFLSVQYSAWL